MNQMFTKQKARFVISLVLILFITCEKDATKSVYNPDQEFNADPVITSIEPSAGALSGIGQITINGSNFSTTKGLNVVFFGSTIGNVLSATESKLIVQTPSLIGDSIDVKVSVVGAQLYSNSIYYPIEDATHEMGGYGNVGENLYALTVDANENVYVFRSIRFIDIISPDSINKSQLYGTAPVVTTGMKMGPGGYLYLTKNNTTLYRMPPGGGNQVPFSAMPQKVFDLDFDQNGNIYIGGEGDSLYIVYPDASSESVAEYMDTFIKAVRVYNGYVYVAGNQSGTLEAVWRNQINAPSDLDPNELVFDVTTALGEGIEVQSLTFADDGDMYVGTTAAPDPILVVHPDGSHEPLYPGVLGPEMYDMDWGNDVYLYVTRRASVIAGTETRILRINMQKLGAPYYGRQL
jgi:hypothetical protein